MGMINMYLSEAARVLQSTYRGEDVRFDGCSTDSRSIRSGELFIALRGEFFDGHHYIEQAGKQGAAAAIVEKGQNSLLPTMPVENTRQALGELATYWRKQFTTRLFAVTGSNGKTTVKNMLTNILRITAKVLATEGNLNNDIGLPLTLLRLNEAYQYIVLEMGANHVGEIAYLSKIAGPDLALITQCAPAHLAGFGSLDGVANAKAEIYEGLAADGTAVINADDDYAGLWRDKCATRQQIDFGIRNKAMVSAEDIRLNDTGCAAFSLLTPVGKTKVQLRLPGRHNVMNALAAATCAVGANTDIEVIKQGLESVSIVSGRLDFKKGINGCCLIDDSYNANPCSVQVALELLDTLPGKHWVVLGDMGELGSAAVEWHEKIGKAVRDMGMERFFAIGTLSRASVHAFGSGGQHFADMRDLLSALRSEIYAGVTVLIKGSRSMRMERIVSALQEGD